MVCLKCFAKFVVRSECSGTKQLAIFDLVQRVGEPLNEAGWWNVVSELEATHLIYLQSSHKDLPKLFAAQERRLRGGECPETLAEIITFCEKIADEFADLDYHYDMTMYALTMVWWHCMFRAGKDPAQETEDNADDETPPTDDTQEWLTEIRRAKARVWSSWAQEQMDRADETTPVPKKRQILRVVIFFRGARDWVKSRVMQRRIEGWIAQRQALTENERTR